MDAIKTLLAVVGSYTVVSVVLSVWQYFRGNRTGNSGRFKHWSDEDD